MYIAEEAFEVYLWAIFLAVIVYVVVKWFKRFF